MEILLIFVFTAWFIVLCNLISIVSNGEKVSNSFFFGFAEIISIVVAPFIFLVSFDFSVKNECCGDSAVFAPGHSFTVYLLVVCCTVAYFYASWTKRLAPPLFELVVNCFLLGGIILNVFVAIQLDDSSFVIMGNVPIIGLFLITLFGRHQIHRQEINEWTDKPHNRVEKICYWILQHNFFIKFPLLVILFLPILIVIGSVLLLLGQKPDSFIRAFTDTYKHGFSQLNHLCDNVQCGGHYLCSVAANGHPVIVKPKRYGKRKGGQIICNRQLLVSNAFEELIEERWPRLHRLIRTRYDRVGDIIHRNYKLFDNKYYSDAIYLLMKPAEWMFVITLYLCDRKPESRIAQQYLDSQTRKQIRRIKEENFF